MKRRPLTFADLDRLLRQLQFTVTTTLEGHRVYRHAPTDTLVALPRVRVAEAQGSTHAIAIRRLLDERGVIERDAFDDLLRDIVQARTDSSAPAAPTTA